MHKHSLSLTHTLEYYSSIKEENPAIAATWMDLEVYCAK